MRNKKTTKKSQASSCSACFMVPLRFWLWDPLLGPMIVEVGTLSHYLQGFSTIPGGFLAGFQHPSTSINHGMISGHPPQTIFGYLSTSSIICAQKKQKPQNKLSKRPVRWATLVVKLKAHLEDGKGSYDTSKFCRTLCQRIIFQTCMSVRVETPLHDWTLLGIEFHFNPVMPYIQLHPHSSSSPKL